MVVCIQASEYNSVAGDKSVTENYMLDRLSPKDGKHILDAGAGDGRLTAEILKRAPGARVEGFEIDQGMDKARERGVDVRQLDIAELDTQTGLAGTYDKVFSNLALMWLKNKENFARAFRGFNYVLKPEGTLVANFVVRLFEPIENASTEVLQAHRLEANIPFRHVTKEELKNVLEQSGFGSASIETHHRKSPLPEGIRPWIKAFLKTSFFEGKKVSDAEQEQIWSEIEEKLKASECYDNGKWFIVSNQMDVVAKKERELAVHRDRAMPTTPAATSSIRR